MVACRSSALQLGTVSVTKCFSGHPWMVGRYCLISWAVRIRQQVKHQRFLQNLATSLSPCLCKTELQCHVFQYDLVSGVSEILASLQDKAWVRYFTRALFNKGLVSPALVRAVRFRSPSPTKVGVEPRCANVLKGRPSEGWVRRCWPRTAAPSRAAVGLVVSNMSVPLGLKLRHSQVVP